MGKSRHIGGSDRFHLNSNQTLSTTNNTFRIAPLVSATFITKLYRILNNQDHQQLISWTPSGSQFCVHDIEQFSSQILPLYFKHSNWPSFVRQLNMYGFHKVGSLHTTSTTNERQHNGLMCKFKHIDFQRDQPSLLQHIRRKRGRLSYETTFRCTGMGDIAHQKEIPSTHEPESIHRPSSTFKPTTDSAPMTTSPSSLSEKAVNINRSLDNVCQMNTNIDMLKKKTESVQEDLDSLRNCVFQQQQLIERIAAIVPDSKDTNTERSRKMIQQDIHHVRQMLLSTQMHSLDLSQSKPCEQSTSKNKSDALKITSLIHSSSPKNKRWANHLFYDSTSSDSSSSKKK